MTFRRDKDPTEFFSVVGAAYVPERHHDSGHLPGPRSGVQQPETGVAGLWLLFYAVVIGGSLLGHGVAKLSHIASLALQ
jgi:hypothetical protein